MDLQDNSYGKHEQIISQFLLKSLHIILHSRVPAFSSSGRGSDMLSGTPVKRSDKWFSLVLGYRPAALDNLNFWHRNLVEPMIIDILLAQEVLGGSSENASSALGLGGRVETVIERWVVQYEHARTSFPQVGESSSSYKKTYKKSIILLRSLYSMMRLLPAYKAFRKICSSSQHSDFAINYKISSFCVPFSREVEAVTKQYDFPPVDTPQGHLSISVTYRESLCDFNLDTSTSFPPEIITDYVGSPAADPFKAFPSLEKGVSAASSSVRGVRPPSSPFQRPHSWTSGLHRISHVMPLSGSPPIRRSSTASYDSPSPPTDVNVHRIQNYRVPTHHNSTSFNEYQLSPPFSPSPTSSSPTYLLGGNPIHTRGHSVTAPVSIPHQVLGRSPKYLSPTMSDPSRSLLPPLSPRSRRLDPSSQDSPSGIRLSRKLDLLRAGELSSGMINQYSGQKVSRDSKDESGRFSGVLSSSGSPRIGVSRSSSRLSFQEDLDDCDFLYPFIVDDVDTLDSPDSRNLDGRKGAEFTSQALSASRKSQDAAVSELVHTLRNAPPLRQDSSCYASLPSKMEPDGEVASAFAMSIPRKTSDALEELKVYRELKDLLLSKSGTQLVSKGET